MQPKHLQQLRINYNLYVTKMLGKNYHQFNKIPLRGSLQLVERSETAKPLPESLKINQSIFSSL